MNSALIFAAIEYRVLRGSVNNFILAKTAGLWVMPLAITVLFYSYTTISGTENLIADIGIFVGSVALGQLTSSRILVMEPLSENLRRVSLVGLVSLGVVYAVFTFYPPHSFLFQDPNSGAYGILQ